MKLTNKHRLPSVFVNFEKNNAHSTEGAKYSVTKLIDSVKISRLRSKHSEEIEEDISDRAWAILGTAVHNILEMGATEGEIAEERLHAEINGIDVSGQIDLQTPHQGGMLLSDYKTVSAFSLVANPDGKPEHNKQLNCYAAIARLNNIKVSGLEIIAIIRDWSSSQAEKSDDYPAAPIVRIPIDMWDEAVALEYLTDRVTAHEREETPDCTFEEMWARPPVYAVHETTKGGDLRKRATRLFDTRTDAEMFSLEKKGSSVIERPRFFARCEGNYCRVVEHCNQYRRIKDGNS